MFAPTLNELVDKSHPYRKLLSVIDFNKLLFPYSKQCRHVGRNGYGVIALGKALILQWMEDLSDRELERYLQENLSGKYFCGFDLEEKTPTFSTFSVFRKTFGTKKVSELFNKISASLKAAGLVSEIFTFVDASHMIAKGALWEERDKAIANKEEKLNNLNVKKYASDKDARFGAKNKHKYWFGYKRHHAIDMKQGFITKVAATPANVDDGKALKHICPKQGAVVADKGYCTASPQQVIKANGCHDATIKKNNMKSKNKEKDRFLSQIRAPYEGNFSKMSRRTRYRGLTKTQLQCFMEAMAHNFKRLIAINAPPLELAT